MEVQEFTAPERQLSRARVQPTMVPLACGESATEWFSA
jgi:hypothetical protein